jgi:hypothetical protein
MLIQFNFPCPKISEEFLNFLILIQFNSPWPNIREEFLSYLTFSLPKYQWRSFQFSIISYSKFLTQMSVKSFSVFLYFSESIFHPDMQQILSLAHWKS